MKLISDLFLNSKSCLDSCFPHPPRRSREFKESETLVSRSPAATSSWDFPKGPALFLRCSAAAVLVLLLPANRGGVRGRRRGLRGLRWGEGSNRPGRCPATGSCLPAGKGQLAGSLPVAAGSLRQPAPYLPDAAPCGGWFRLPSRRPRYLSWSRFVTPKEALLVVEVHHHEVEAVTDEVQVVLPPLEAF